MKKIVCAFMAAFLIVCALSVPAFADSATISLSKSNVTVGSNVAVTLRYNAGFAMYGIDVSLTYNNAVLQYVSGGTNQGSTVKMVETLSGETSKSFTVNFKAIAAGSGSLSLSAKASGSGDGSASAGATINVTTPQPSSNNNLSSIKLSEGKLSPAFKASVLNYSAAVKNTTEKITISANAQAGDSVVSGAGTFSLKMGDNSFPITVTAASGDKKTYNLVIKRMTEEETAAAAQKERDDNPRLFVIDGADYMLETKLSFLGQIDGYTLSSETRKGANIEVLSDNAGKYKLFWATDAAGENGTFYTCDAQDNFTRVDYIRINERLYIIEPFESNINIEPGFVPEKYNLYGREVDCYKYDDKELSDFYIFNCYIGGTNDYYRFDSAQNTMQREPKFLAKEIDTVDEVISEPETNKTGLLDKFKQLGTQAKILVCLIAVAVILVVVLIVLLIIRAVARKKDLNELSDNENLDFDLIFGSDEEKAKSVDIENDDTFDMSKKTEEDIVKEETEKVDEPDSETESEFLDYEE